MSLSRINSVFAGWVVLLGLSVLVFCCCSYESESSRIRNLQIPDVDLSRIDDGKYTGRVEHHDNTYELALTVAAHEVTEIQVLSCEGDEYDIQALVVLDRVITEQSLTVDAVSGATKSSKLYLMAAYNALTGEELAL
jgi:uncharacterized protein with FMN-binding domain